MLEFHSTSVRLPNAVPYALEEERLVLFCGAGISLYTGLPDFRRLTLDLFAECGVPLAERPRRAADFCETLTLAPGEPEDLAFWEGKYDRALALLEKKVPRRVVRQKLVERLSSEPPADQTDCTLHRDLMALGALRDGGYRLVTTNFDDRFERAARQDLVNAWEAPRIAVPRPASWRSLTFLHGRILKDGDRGAEDLIVTSGDFGRAYLQDGWAARFVVELFREFTVLFVGYSINDPVMTYLVDAIALDRESGRPFRQPYALVGLDEGVQEKNVRALWRSKNVEPILYPSADRHRALHPTIAEWAALHRGGFEARLTRACDILRSPCGPEAEADPRAVESLVWALSKPDGSVARAIAEGQGDGGPEGPLRIAWLRPLLAWGDRVAGQSDGAADGKDNPTGAFQIDGRWLGDPLAPPAQPDDLGRHILRSPLFGPAPWVKHHPVAWHLARWIASRVCEPELARIVAERKGRIGPVLRDAIEWALTQQREPLPGDLDKYWRIVLRANDDEASDRAGQQASTDAVRRAKAQGLDADARSRLLQAFEPRISIAPTWVTPDLLRDEAAADAQADGAGEPAYALRTLAELRVKLGGRRYDPVRTVNWLQGPGQAHLLADLAADLGECLVRVLRCAEWIEDTGPRSFHASWLPSLEIAAVPNDGIGAAWLPLLILCRDAQAAHRNHAPEAGTRLLHRWSDYGRQPWGALFVRLVLHAATSQGQGTDIALDLIKANANDLMWNGAFAGELRPFLRALGIRVGRGTHLALERLWRAGPPQDHWSHRRVGNPGEEHPYCEDLIDQRLAWLLEGGASLTREGTRRGQRQLDAWLAAGQGAAEPSARAAFELIAPPDTSVLVTLPPPDAAVVIEAQDDWEAGRALDDYARHDPSQAIAVFDLLRQSQPERAAYLLEHLAAGAGAGAGPDRFVQVGTQLVAYLGLADVELHGYWGYGAWLQAAAKDLAVDQEAAAAFWTLWDRIWSTAQSRAPISGTDSDGLIQALNAPGGMLCLALLDRLWKRELGEGLGLPADLRPRFDAMADGDEEAHRHARAMLVSRLVWLYRICPEWCDQHLVWRLGDFAWPDGEAPTLWQALMWPAAGSAKLWPVLKPRLIDALGRLDRFAADDRRRLVVQFAATWLRPGTFDEGDTAALSGLFSQFDAEVLESLAWMWSDALRVQGEAAATLWREQIAPRVASYWPLRASAKSPALNARLGEMLLRTREAFPDGLRMLTDPSERPALGPADGLLLVVDALVGIGGGGQGTPEGFDYIQAFPCDVLKLLDTLVGPGVTERWHNDLLARALDGIAVVDPNCDPAAMGRLRDFVRSG